MAHLQGGESPPEYNSYLRGKVLFLGLGIILLAVLFFISISLGPIKLSLTDILSALLRLSEGSQAERIIWSIRLPQALAGIVAGAGLAVTGAVLQSVLRNPLGSPFTLGMSNAAAFGAALSLLWLHSAAGGGNGESTAAAGNYFFTTAMAFGFCLLAAVVIILISRIRGSKPETLILTGVAIGSLFSAATMLIQFFADDVQLAAMVFWTFGDLSRAGWPEIGLLSVVTAAGIVYFLSHCWDYNAMDCGDETAMGLGVSVARLRVEGMFIACLITAAIVAVLGIIGFVGLIAPHMVRRLIDDEHRYLLPASVLAGACLLLAADTAARLVLAPRTLPVAILTAFLGAPAFIYLILRRS